MITAVIESDGTLMLWTGHPFACLGQVSNLAQANAALAEHGFRPDPWQPGKGNARQQTTVKPVEKSA